ncbi:MAG: ADP-forming succinate--CoA ligase subunit beta [Alphaproteobacteria bacterium]|nr:ADP-forming succinate--CoA ligase subunit beta [Alphaproteobacteria bacterium]
MNIHEYQAKKLLAGFGVPVPEGAVALSPGDVAGAVGATGGPLWVVKAQIHAGGRGKAGGVKLCKTAEDAKREATAMFGKTLVTPQTGPGGRVVKRVYVEKGSDIAHELYCALLVDRGSGRVAVIASTEGGVEIEKVAHDTPEKIVTVPIDPATGYQPFHGRKIAFALGLAPETAKQAQGFFGALYKAFVALDASQVEINPLIVTKQGQLVALDAKLNFDDNALYRHKDVVELRDEGEEDPKELEASRHELNYIKLDGSIGCMVNGAGLAMATMDIIKLNGGAPANFLDVGGGAQKDRVIAAFRIILSDPNVKGILVNIFGGIMRCDIIAEGIIAAAKEIGIEVPLVVRLAGTNVEKANELLAASGLSLIAANDLGDAARKVVAAVKGGR